MHDALSSVGLLALTVAAVIVTRPRGVVTKVIVEAVFLGSIGAFLVWQGVSLLPHSALAKVDPPSPWLRALAVIWWLIGARLIVNLSVLTRRRDPRSRQARLFSDLTAAVIYITAVLIILSSVFDLNIGALLATSGVIAIILGLALQNTLADVFSGIAVGLESRSASATGSRLAARLKASWSR